MNIKKWMHYAIKKLSAVHNPQYESEILLSYITGKNRTYILSSDYIFLKKHELKHLNYLVYRRSQGEPIAYITGKKEFWSLSLLVSSHTLIPRPDTEILVEQALSKIKNDPYFKILDLGTGSGAIALALGQSCSKCDIIGVDKSQNAIKIAQSNAFQLNVKNVSFYYSNWFSKITKKFHLIVSNPPYVSQKDIPSLQKEIFFEPFEAIISKKNGLSDIQIIIKNASCYLFARGWLCIEHGWNQKKQVQHFFKKYNFYKIESYQDYGGNDRVTIGQKKIS